MHPLLSCLLLFSSLACGCGGRRSLLPDYSEWLAVGVSPEAEADALISGFERAGYTLIERIDGAGWIAFEARRDPGLRAIRVVTSRGAALVLDSHEPDGVRPRHGRIELIPPPHPSGHDLDGDGRDEIVVGAWHGDQRCLLPFRIRDTGEAHPLVPVLDELGPNACVEAIRDIDENGRMEGIAVLRMSELAHDVIPTIEAPLELDEHDRFRAGPPPVRFLVEERDRRARALEEAVRNVDIRQVYRLAIELAALSRIAGNTRDAQLQTFDEAISRVVWTEDFAIEVRAAREFIENSWRE